MSISKNFQKIAPTVPSVVTLVAVSKFHPESDIMEAYQAGYRTFGESRPQELVRKYEALPKDIEWHMIGHLQTNKIRPIAPFVTLIHSIDSLRLAQAVSAEGEHIGRQIPVLLQVHVAREETKSGFTPDELLELLTNGTLQSLSGMQLKGIMAMASLTDDTALIRNEFHQVKMLFDTIKANHLPSISMLSMGMSSDYMTAIEQGSTIVRIGSALFGTRT